MSTDPADYELLEADALADPLAQFQRWFDDAVAFGFKEPGAMTLATVSPEGHPSARMVLFKGLKDGGFTFYTNYTSRKGRELDQNEQVALVFYWDRMYRQVRIEGRAERTGESDSEAYFHSRPRGSQLGALASRQSRVVENREALDQRMREVEARYEDAEVPWQPYWGGFRVVPTLIEFWQGRANRMHDRLQYRSDGGRWVIERLEP